MREATCGSADSVAWGAALRSPGWVDDGAEVHRAPQTETGEGDDGDGVVLTTFHRAKGLQWPTASSPDSPLDLFPSCSARDEPAIAEERRLLYVALTRAESDLTCTWARFHEEGGAGTPRKASPWLEPVNRCVERMQRESRPLGPTDASARIGALRALLEPHRAKSQAQELE